MTHPVVVADYRTTQRGPGSELRDPGSELYPKREGAGENNADIKKWDDFFFTHPPSHGKQCKEPPTFRERPTASMHTHAACNYELRPNKKNDLTVGGVFCVNFSLLGQIMTNDLFPVLGLDLPGHMYS